MNTDCAFYIGTTHDVCQDYALAGKNSIAISDGCSGSPRSDIGSRVLSITAMNKMVELGSLYDFNEQECILLARPAIKMLNIPNECLDATLLAAISYEESLHAICCGDGVIAIKTKTGNTILIDNAYVDNFPFYMNYLYDTTGRYKNWKENYNNRKITETVISSSGDIISNSEVTQHSRIHEDIGLIMVLDNKIFLEISAIDDVEYLAIMSDGVHSFYETVVTETSRCNQPISYIDVAKDLLSFKNFNTSFVQRRINKFRKNCTKKNWGNRDDVSLSVIYLGEK